MSSEFRSFADRLLSRRDPRLPLIVLQSVASTNGLARRIVRRRSSARRTPDFALVAWRQTAGYGRYGRRWSSPRGGGIWATLVLGSVDATELELLPLRAGVVLQGVLQPYSSERIVLKWPNDLLVERAKIGGILAEAVTRGTSSSVMVGFGVNYGQEAPAVEDRLVTSLGRHCDALPSLPDLASTALSRLYEEFQRRTSRDDLVDQVRRLLVHQPGDSLVVTTPVGSVAGQFREISALGSLVIETPEGLRAFAAGEVESI